MKVSSRSFPMNQFARKYHLVFTLCALCAFVVNFHAQNFRQVHPGVEFAEVQHKIGNDPLKINLLRLDLKKVRLDVHHALDRAIGLETTSSIAKRKGAVAAINAGFFRLDKSEFAGDAAGILQIDGRLLSESSLNRSAILIKNDRRKSRVHFQPLSIEIDVLGSGIWKATGINRERRPNDVLIFTPEFNNRTLTNSEGAEFVVVNERITEVFLNRGNSTIPRNGIVLSVSGLQKDELVANLKIGQRLRYAFPLDQLPHHGKSSQTGNFQVSQAEDITNGVPQLIKDGKIDITWEQEKASRAFAESRHPRTAVAKLKDGKFLMMTVDGRQPGVSVGMSLQELAEYLLSLGAIDAMNLDGGGSTTMVLDGKVVNKPSDKEGERRVSDAILVTLRKRGFN